MIEFNCNLPVKINEPLNIFVSRKINLYGLPGSEVSLEPEFLYELIDTLISFFEKLDCEILMLITNQNA